MADDEWFTTFSNFDAFAGSDGSKRPSIARMYDFLLGGDRNFEVDREVARAALRHMPDLARVLRANRSYLGRVVRALISENITQFVDLGSGIPTVGNVHEIAQRADPGARVVYVDLDPVAVLVANELLAEDSRTIMVQADAREPDAILDRPDVTALLDLTQPVGVLLVATLHLIPDQDRPAQLLDRLYERVAPGSFLAVSHMSPAERQTPVGMRPAQAVYDEHGAQLYPRTLREIEGLLGRWLPLPPGIVACPLWRPDAETEPLDPHVTFPGYALLARKSLKERPKRLHPQLSVRPL